MQQESATVGDIHVHQPRHEEVTMGENEYYAFVMMNLDLRLITGVNELTSGTWSVGSSVCEWDGTPGCLYVEIESEELKQAGITPSDAVGDKN